MLSKEFKTVLFSAFAVFAMFFGAGNLLFPISVGINTQNNLTYSILGLLVTGILVPYIALITPMLTKGKDTLKDGNILNHLDSKTSSAVLTLIVLLIGPFGGIPRCIAFSFVGIKDLLQVFHLDINLEIFGIVFLAICILLIFSSKQIVNVIGNKLAPMLILGLIAMFVIAILQSNEIKNYSGSNLQAMIIGLKEGYNTMDMLAAILFYKIIIRHINTQREDIKTKMPLEILSSSLGMLMLTIVYAALVYVGAKFSVDLASTTKERTFSEASLFIFGPYSILISGIIIMLACLTTVIALMEITSEWVLETSKQITKIHYKTSIVLISAISYIMTLLGFDNIMSFIASIMYIIYPALIGLNIGVLIDKSVKLTYARYLFWISLSTSTIYHFLW